LPLNNVSPNPLYSDTMHLAVSSILGEWTERIVDFMAVKDLNLKKKHHWLHSAAATKANFAADER
jgi:hypothetical protein